jgi:hypothetical protein
MFGWSARVRGDTIRYRDVRLCRFHSKKGHACSLLHGRLQKLEIESAIPQCGQQSRACEVSSLRRPFLSSKGVIIGYAIRRGKFLQ